MKYIAATLASLATTQATSLLGHTLQDALSEFEWREDKLTVHLIHHTHDDVGWLKSVDEYFSGVNNDIQRVEVQLILDSVMRELIADPLKKFSYVEMKFFSMWWKNQSEELKTQVRQLVSEGRLEMLNAGWSMHDEACPHYEDMINNMMAGHDFVEAEFGVRPRIGWQIDPFGHSNANARLFAEMGFDAFFFGRIDEQDKERRLDTKEMEFVWRPMWNTLGESTQIFAHTLYNLYVPPKGFDWDTLGSDDPFIDDKSLSTFNADTKVALMYEWVTEQAKHYKSNDLLVTMGMDFNYQNAHQNFKSSDGFIRYWNDNILPQTNIEMIYSTPSMYTDAIAAQEIVWPTKYDDMFPYANNDYTYWTGFYSSRANDKKYFRDASHVLHASNKLFALASIDQKTTDSNIKSMLDAKQAMMDVVGVIQHHDGITGTGKQHVADEYARSVYEAIKAANPAYAREIEKLADQAGISDSEWLACQRTNGTWRQCPISAYALKTDYNMIAATHNPSNLPLKTIELKVPHDRYRVEQMDQLGGWDPVQASVICNEQEKEFEPEQTELQCRMYVSQVVLPGQVAFTKLIFDEYSQLNKDTCDQGCSLHQIIESDELSLEFRGLTEAGVAFLLTDKVTGDVTPLDFELRYWSGYQIHWVDNNQPSGVYIFRPTEGQYDSFTYSRVVNVEIAKCDVKDQFVITFKAQDPELGGDGVVTITIEDLPVLKYEVELFGIPYNQDIGFEVTANFVVPSFDNGGVFYTDANGLEMQERRLNYRPTWDFNPAPGGLNITANYYPVQTAISMYDNKTQMQLTVMNDRSQGGSVVKPGRIELMQNRRLNRDDWKGMGECLQESNADGVGITVPATYWVQLFNREKRPTLQRTMQQRQDAPPMQFFTFNAKQVSTPEPVSQLVQEGYDSLLKECGFTAEMKLEMFTLGRNKIMLRVENIADTIDSDGQVVYEQVNLKRLVHGLFELVNGDDVSFTTAVTELSLTGNQDYETMLANRIVWKTVDNQSGGKRRDQLYVDVIDMQQQRIRVFRVEYQLTTDTTTFLQ